MYFDHEISVGLLTVAGPLFFEEKKNKTVNKVLSSEFDLLEYIWVPFWFFYFSIRIWTNLFMSYHLGHIRNTNEMCLEGSILITISLANG